MATRKKLDLRQWWEEVGTDNAETLALNLGTSLAYLRLLSYRAKRPSYDLAKRIIAAAERLTPGFVPDLDLLMQPVIKTHVKQAHPGRKRIQPSTAFARATSKRVAA